MTKEFRADWFFFFKLWFQEEFGKSNEGNCSIGLNLPREVLSGITGMSGGTGFYEGQNDFLEEFKI